MAEVITEIIYAISDILHQTNQKFMDAKAISITTRQIFMVLAESEKRKQENESVKNSADDDEHSRLDEENQQEDELHIAVSELIGMVFKTQQEVALPLANNIYSNLLSKALQPSHSSQIHTFAVNIINDMIEHLGFSLYN